MLHDLLKDILSQSAGRETFQPTIVLWQAVWPQLVGQDLSMRTRPLRLEDGVLFIAVSSSGWLAELERHKLPLRERLAMLWSWNLPQLTFLLDPEHQGSAASRPETSTARAERQHRAPSTDKAGNALDAADRVALEHLEPDTRALLLRIRKHLRHDES